MFKFTTQDVWIANKVRQFKIVDHPGTAATMIVDDGSVLLVEQYRPAARRKLMELPAGVLEVGEEPLECAKRELKEETGYTAEKWQSLGKIIPTPGYTTEVLHLYLASNITKGEQRLDEGEDLAVHWIPLAKLEQMIDQGEIADAKTIVAFLKHQNLK